MAKRWSFIEDYIIGKFCEENEHEDIRDDLLDELVDRLTETGFDSRCRVTVQRRAREFTYLFRGWDSPYTTEQINKVYNYLKKRNVEQLFYNELQINITDSYISSEVDFPRFIFSVENPDVYQFICTEPLAPSFKDVLTGFINKSGMTDAEVYRASRISRDKFNHIINGRKGKKVKETSKGQASVSKRTIMQLCFGLKLSYDEAIVLMESAGYAFRKNDLTEVIVVICLKQGIHDMDEVNCTLYENNLEIFAETRDSK